MATDNQNAVRSLLQRLQDEVDVQARGARHADYPARDIVLQLHRAR
jgi:hypothetical protein